MYFITRDGARYEVDLKARTVSFGRQTLSFSDVCYLFKGSDGARFLGTVGNVILQTGAIVDVVGSPTDQVTGEAGNVVFHTYNSVYEIDQEQKLIRRLAGLNQRTASQSSLDGDWEPYLRAESIEVGSRGVIIYDGSGRYLTTSTIRQVDGVFVTNPSPV